MNTPTLNVEVNESATLHELQKLRAIVATLASEVRSANRSATGDTRAMARNPICRHLLTLFGAWLWETDEEHRFVHISPEFSSAMSCDPSFFLNQTRLQVSQESGIEPIGGSDHERDLKNGLEFYDYVYRIMLPSGKSRWVKVSGLPRFDMDSQFVGYWGVGIDCTAEKESKLSEQRKLSDLGVALDTLDVSVLILDESNRISYRNSRWLELHAELPEVNKRIGSAYLDYLNGCVKLDLFPEAIDLGVDEFVFTRMKINENPPTQAFKQLRQDGIVLSVRVKKLYGGGTLIVSSDVTQWH